MKMLRSLPWRVLGLVALGAVIWRAGSALEALVVSLLGAAIIVGTFGWQIYLGWRAAHDN